MSGRFCDLFWREDPLPMECEGPTRPVPSMKKLPARPYEEPDQPVMTTREFVARHMRDRFGRMMVGRRGRE